MSVGIDNANASTNSPDGCEPTALSPVPPPNGKPLDPLSSSTPFFSGTTRLNLVPDNLSEDRNLRGAPRITFGTHVCPQLGGYVLLISDVTEAIDLAAGQIALFQNLVEGTRGALANIRAAIETLIEHADMDAGRRARFAGIIRDEAVRLSDRLHATTADVSERLKVRWPLEEMRGEDLLTLARSRIERRVPLPVKLESVDPELWLRVDSFSMAQPRLR